MFCRIAYGTEFYLRTTRGNTDNHAQRWRKQSTACMYHLDKSPHHLFASSKVCYHAIAQWANGADIFVCLLVHQLRTFANSYHFVCTAIEGHNRRFVHHNFVIADDDGVRCAEVHCNFLHKRKESHVSIGFIWSEFVENRLRLSFRSKPRLHVTHAGDSHRLQNFTLLIIL